VLQYNAMIVVISLPVTDAAASACRMQLNGTYLRTYLLFSSTEQQVARNATPVGCCADELIYTSRMVLAMV